jgi:hypothetical protein
MTSAIAARKAAGTFTAAHVTLTAALTGVLTLAAAAW